MKKSVKLLLTLGVVLILIGAGLFISTGYKPKTDGTIVVEVIDNNDVLLNRKEINFSNGDDLVKLLDKNFDDVEDGMLMSIDQLCTPEDFTTFICIYVDDEMSQVGILDIQYKDGTKITFKDTVNTYAGN